MQYTDILTNVRSIMGVDSNQYSTAKITASINKALDKVTGYAIGADKTFRWDDTNQTKLPIGTTDLSSSASYSFLTDEQGNRILTLLEVSLVDSTGKETRLNPIDRTQNQDFLNSFSGTTGVPQFYDKISDNVVVLYPTPSTEAIATYDIKFRFQRTPSYFLVTDTTKEPGCAPILNDYLIYCAALEGAVALGLPNLASIKVIHDEEKEQMINYFTTRNEDDQPFRMTGRVMDCR